MGALRTDPRDPNHPCWPIVRELILMRWSKGLTQSDIARACGVSKQTVEAWESGRTTPRVDHLVTWCALLGCGIGLFDAPANDRAEEKVA